MNGCQSIRTILNYLRENNDDGRHDEVINGYHGNAWISGCWLSGYSCYVLGCIIDLFTCDDRFNKAIEVTAEGRLFYHVVDNDKIAMKLLKVMNDRELRGEVNFFPINRMTAREKRNVNDKVCEAKLSSRILSVITLFLLGGKTDVE